MYTSKANAGTYREIIRQLNLKKKKNLLKKTKKVNV